MRAAMRLVDDRGLGALTMRALATELGVSPMALYNHVRDKEELLDLMLDLMLGEVDCSETDGDWVGGLRTLTRSFHQVLTRHNQLARVYNNQVRIGPHGLLIIERALTLLLEAGFSPEDAAAAFLTLYTYTVGRHQMGRIAPYPGAKAHDQAEYFQALPMDRIPSIRKASRHLGGVQQPGVFEFGLDALLTGLQAKLAAQRGDSTPAAS